jgi:hypothetical protein
MHINNKKMDVNPITTNDLKLLKSKMERGDIAVIAERTSRSRRHIMNVLNSTAQDLEVLDAISELLDERTKKAQKIKNRINGLCNE